MSRGAVFILLVAILTFGAFIRLEYIHESSMWLDEGITYYNSGPNTYGGVWDRVSRLDQSPPGYYFFMHTYREYFADTEFNFRVTSVVFGVLSILFLYLLISAIFNEEAGVFAAFLLAINPFHIGFSVETRMYVLLGLEGLMAFYFLYKALDTEGRGYMWWILFTIISIAGLYTHNFFLFILAGLLVVHFLIWLFAKKKFGKLLLGLLSGLIALIVYAPWLPNFLKQLDVSRYWIEENGFSDTRDYFLDFANQNVYVLWGLIVLGLFGIAWTVFRRYSVDYQKNILGILALLFFLLIGFGAPLAYSLIYEPILKLRCVVYVVPIFLGIASLGIYALRRFSVIFPILLLGAAAYFWMPWQVSAYPLELGEDYRGVVAHIAENPAPVVVHSPSIAHVINFYNQGRFDVHPFPPTDDLTEFSFDGGFKSRYRNFTVDFEEYYLVTSHSHEQPHGLLFVWSDAYCEEFEGWVFENIKVIYFSKCW